MAQLMRAPTLILLAVIGAGCANKQILRNEAIMTKKLGEAVTHLDNLTESAARDRRVSGLMPGIPSGPDDVAHRAAFLVLACDEDKTEFAVQHGLSVYRGRLTELDALAQGPADSSFAALFGSLKKSAEARDSMPADGQASAVFQSKLDAEKKKKNSMRLRCYQIVAHDLERPNTLSASTGGTVAAFLLYVETFRTFLTLAEQTARAGAVREYTARVVGPDLQLVHLYLAGPSDQDPFAVKDLPADPVLSSLCTRRAAAFEKGTYLASDRRDVSIGHGRLAEVVARTRATAVRSGYLHYLAAIALKNANTPEARALGTTEAVAAASELARVDDLINVDIDCSVLPKLKESQESFVKAVESGSKGSGADNFIDALTNVQALLDALEKTKQ